MAKQRQARKCKGKRTDGNPCGNWAMLGALVCRSHGGKAPQVQAQAQENLADERIDRMLYRYQAESCANPLEALQRLAGRALALERAIGEMVNRLGDELRYEHEKGGEQLRSEVTILERAMDRCGRLLVDIAKLNIEERLARVTERQAEMVQAALDASMAEMGYPPAEQTAIRKSVARHLRAVPAA